MTRDKGPREIVLLGSTGSIGTQAIDIVRRNPDRFRVVALGAGGGNVGLLAAQALELGVEVGRRWPRRSAVAGPAARLLRRGRSSAATPAASSGIPKILAGPEAMTELAAVAVRRRAQRDRRLARAWRRRWPRCAAGRTLALANKESLIVGRPAGHGRWPGRARSCRSTPSTPRWPSACAAGRADEVRRLVLTASGGPFRGRARDELAEVTAGAGAGPPDLGHGPGRHDQLGDAGQQGPGGDRGARAVRRAATTEIEVVVHPQSVDPLDGRVRRRLDARAGQPARHAAADRAGAGLAGPGAGRGRRGGLDRVRTPGSFGRSTTTAFPAVALATGRRAGRHCRPAIYNAANEECVAALPRGPAAVSRHRRHGRAGRATRRPTFGEPGTVEDVSPPRPGRATRARRVDREPRREGAARWRSARDRRLRAGRS